MKTTVSITILIAMLAMSCASVEKMIDNGDFDAAISKAHRKMIGKEDLKRKYVVLLEEAFDKATTRDMNFVEANYNAHRTADLYAAVKKLEKIEWRQEKVSDLLPIVSTDGYHAKFAFVKTQALKNDLIEQYVSKSYVKAAGLLVRGKEGDKGAAREAYRHFDNIWEYEDSYKDARTLQEEALHMGVSHVGIKMANYSYTHVPEYIMIDLLDHSFENNKWIQFHYGDRNISYDREIEIIIDNIDISPERVTEKVYREDKKIKDGHSYVLDENGNVLKDSLGNDIKRPKFKKVFANVIQTEQFKIARIEGRVVNRNTYTGKVQYSDFDEELLFENFTATYQGDKRALSDTTKKIIGPPPVPFPSNGVMIEDLFEIVGKTLRKRLRNTRLLV